MTGIRRRRHTRASLIAILISIVVIGAATAIPGGQASAARPNKKQGRLVITMKAPVGIVGNVRLSNTTPTLLKPASVKQHRYKLSLKAGTYKLKPISVTSGGATWRAKVTKAKVRPGKTTKVKLTWRKVSQPVKVQVTGTTASSVALGWVGGKIDKYIVRRAAGAAAPSSRSAGVSVPVANKAVSVLDEGLPADTTYSYAVFAQTKVKKTTMRNGKKVKKVTKKWLPPAVITTATMPPADPTAASYSLMPHATVVRPGDTDAVTVDNGQVWVRLMASRPAPVLGAGMALPASAALPGGMLGTIAEVAPDGRTVRLEQAGLPQVFSSYSLASNFDKTIAYQPIEVDNIPDGAADGDGSRQLAKKPAPKTSGFAQGNEARANRSAGPCQTTSGLDISFTPTLTATGRFGAQVHSTWGVPHAVTLDSDVSVTAKAEARMEATAAVACNLEMPAFVVPISTVPVPMSLVWNAKADASADGIIEVSGIGASATASFGATVRLGTDPSFTPRGSVTGGLLNPVGQGSATATVGVGGSLSIGPGVGTTSAGAIAGIGGSFDVLRGTVTGAFGTDEGSSCLKFSASSTATLRLYAKAWMGPLSAEAEWPLLEGKYDWGSRTWPTGCDEVDPTLGSGDVQATLTWRNSDDMDLHVIEPSGEEIYFAHTYSLTDGQLDRDVIPGCSSAETGHSNVENVFWPTGYSPAGEYQVWVHEFSDCTSTDPTWVLTVRVDGRVVLRRSGSGTSPVYTFSNG